MPDSFTTESASSVRIKLEFDVFSGLDDVEPLKTNRFLTFEDILLMFLSPCSPVSVFVPPDPLQLLSVVISGLSKKKKSIELGDTWFFFFR